MHKRTVEILDTTLRDGAQAEGVSYSVNDKFQVLDSLVALGIQYIEAGNPGSNPKDREFFARYGERRPPMGSSALAAFGSTRRKGVPVAEDPGIIDLLSAGTPTVVIFGKVWDVRQGKWVNLTRKQADQFALAIGKKCQVSWRVRMRWYIGVRLGGGGTWKGYRLIQRISN